MIPHIEEQYFGDEAKLKEFAFDKLRGGPDEVPPQLEADGAGAGSAADENGEQTENTNE